MAKKLPINIQRKIRRATAKARKIHDILYRMMKEGYDPEVSKGQVLSVCNGLLEDAFAIYSDLMDIKEL